MKKNANAKFIFSPAAGMRTAACFLFISASFLPAFAANFDRASAGTSAGQFLKISPDARGAAMGEAFGALSDTANSLFWNPATLIRIKKESYAFTHSPYLVSSSHEYLAYARNSGEVGSWGFALRYMSYGSIKEMSLTGLETGKFSPYDMSLSVGFATYITGFKKDESRRFVLGATGKLVRTKIQGSDNTVSADIGLLFPEMFGGKFIMGVSAHNIMGSLRISVEEYPLPLFIRLATLTKLSKYYSLTADIVAPRDNVPYLAMGNELRVYIKKFTVSLRGGFNTRAIFDVYGFRNITFGGGFGYGKYSLDYSFTPYGELGNAHRISLGVNF